MASQKFNAESWISFSNKDDPNSARNLSYIPQSDLKKKHPLLSDFLINGWQGPGLITTTFIEIEHLISQLKIDVRKEFDTLRPQFNKTLILDIYNEFLDFAETQNHNIVDIFNYQSFWEKLTESQVENDDIVNSFLEVYFSRVVLFYFMKMRFIVYLSLNIGHRCSEKELLNPNSFLTVVFQQNRPNEIFSESLTTNHYSSWYRPTPGIIGPILKVLPKFHKISMSELEKIFSFTLFRKNKKDALYSHSLSNTIFGQFLTNLVLKYRHWSNSTCANSISGHADQGNQPKVPQPLSVKFCGQYISSMALSHWLAQENGQKNDMNSIICPDFIGATFYEGKFLQLVYELQFLFNLISMSKVYDYRPIDFISNVLKKNKEHQFKGFKQQFSLFEDEKFDKTYDSVILNLVNFPSKNPHHFLTTQIMRNLDNLCDEGLLFVMSSQNLFVPSQGQRIQCLLDLCMVQGHIDLTHLKGRGEVASHIYILKKKSSQCNKGEEKDGALPGNFEEFKATENVYPCFRFKGDLKTFHKFRFINDEMTNFLNKEKNDIPPLLKKELNGSYIFDYFHDAIKDGQIINSISRDSSQITHPKYFDKLIKSCTRLSTFFHINQIFSNQDKVSEHLEQSNRILGDNGQINMKSYPLILIIDRRSPSKVKLEIILTQSYQAKSNEYGFALCYYFGLTPKVNRVNINLFRDFFNSNIGEQIIQSSLSGPHTKLKSSLSSFLVPSFFHKTLPIPTFYKNQLKFADTYEEDVKVKSPKELANEIKTIKKLSNELLNEYPCAFMGLIATYRTVLKNVLERVNYNSEVVFSNPFICEKLRKLKTYPLFPGNEDYSIEFKLEQKENLELPLTRIQPINQSSDNICSYGLALYSEDIKLVNIYSEQLSKEFLHTILKMAINLPLSQIIKHIQVPCYKDLVAISENFQEFHKALKYSDSELEALLKSILVSKIFEAY